MNWDEVAKTVFYSLSGLVAIWVGSSFQGIRSDIKDLTESVGELNKNVAVIIERTDGHERRISKLEDNS